MADKVKISICWKQATMLLIPLVVFRGSSEQIGPANRLVIALANSVESEQAKKRSTQQSRSHIPGRTKNVTGKVTDGRKTRPDQTDMFSTDADVCYGGLSVAQESWTVAGEADDSQSKSEQDALTSTAQNSCPVSCVGALSVKEYSLFDNHFSRAVENVLRNDICVYSGRLAFSSAPVDEALLAKAPGYRAMAASPSGGRFLAERPRKYSNDSSSSVSSVRSGEESMSSRMLPSSVSSVRSGEESMSSRMLPSSLSSVRSGEDSMSSRMLPRTSQPVPDLPLSSPFHSVHELPPRIPLSAFTDFCGTVESVSETVDDVQAAAAMAASEHYSSPNQPMTLPRISTNLNPNAPDFVFRPSAHVTALDGLDSTSVSVHPDVLVPCSTAVAGRLFIPAEVPSTGAWNGAAVERGTSVTTTAINVSVPMLALDVSQRHWTVPATLLQESLTFS